MPCDHPGDTLSTATATTTALLTRRHLPRPAAFATAPPRPRCATSAHSPVRIAQHLELPTERRIDEQRRWHQSEERERAAAHARFIFPPTHPLPPIHPLPHLFPIHSHPFLVLSCRALSTVWWQTEDAAKQREMEGEIEALNSAVKQFEAGQD